MHCSSVSWKITPLYLGEAYTLDKRNQSKSKILETFQCLGQDSPNFETKKQFFYKLCITFECYETQSLCTLQLKFYILSTKGAYPSKNFERFPASTRKILHFHGLSICKWSTVSAEKCRKDVLWQWIMIQNLKKNWLALLNKGIGNFGEFSPNYSKVWKFSLGSFCPKYGRVELAK